MEDEDINDGGEKYFSESKRIMRMYPPTGKVYVPDYPLLTKEESDDMIREYKKKLKMEK